ASATPASRRSRWSEAPMTTADTDSGYLRHLPPALWQHQPQAPGFSLAGFLRVFEKILTGIDDGQAVVHGPAGGAAHVHDGIAARIERLHELYDPWKAPAPFLPWLAGWLGLALPPVWDEYQQRKAIGEITGILLQQGLR